VGCVGVGLVVMGHGLNPHAMTASAAQAKESAPTAKVSPSGVDQTGKEKIVYTFSDDAKMSEFTNLWRQRQAVILRMTVLQSYWNEEQTVLKQLNEKFTTDYKLDVAKNYVLDDKRRVLIERELPPGAEVGMGPKGAAAPSGDPSGKNR